MLRFTCVLAAGLLLTTAAAAQQPLLPPAPGVMPGSTIGPGMPFHVNPPLRTPGLTRPGQLPVILPWGWYYPPFSPWYGLGFGYGYGGLQPLPLGVPAQPAVEEPARPPDPPVVLANEFPATLTVQFPAAAELWLDGKKLDRAAAEEHTLTSPVLKANEQYTFKLTARWRMDGKTYEANRAVTLGSGDRSRVLILSGVEARE